MSARLDKLNLVKGFKWERQDPLDNLGVPTCELIKDAIKEGKDDLAKDLIDYWYFWETKLPRDSNYDLTDGLPAFWMVRYGEDTLGDAWSQVMLQSLGISSWPPAGPPKMYDWTPVEWTMAFMLRMVRPHRMGRLDGTAGFVLEEYEDRFEVIWDPCYTGGRNRRGDPISNQPPHTDPPFNFPLTRLPHTWTWNKVGLSGYCCHHALIHEIWATEETGGYLGQMITDRGEYPWDPCRYVAYKDLDWIDEKYYTRIGKTKPKPKAAIPKFKDLTKPIKVTHSHDLGVFGKVTDGEIWLNFVPRIKKALDEGKKEKAIKLVDMMRAETEPGGGGFKWIWKWLDLIADRGGYDDLHDALRYVPSRMEPPLTPNEPRPTKDSIPSAEDRVRKAAAWGRGLLSGPNTEGSVRIIDEPDRIVMELNPCGSGGVSLMTIDKIDEATADVYKELMMDPPLRGPYTKPPFNCGVTQIAHPAGWGKVGIPHVCTRCCAHFETAAIARHGYLTTVVERPANATEPNCRWFFYKDLDDVPEEYYTRIGVKKPARQR